LESSAYGLVDVILRNQYALFAGAAWALPFHGINGTGWRKVPRPAVAALQNDIAVIAVIVEIEATTFFRPDCSVGFGTFDFWHGGDGGLGVVVAFDDVLHDEEMRTVGGVEGGVGFAQTLVGESATWVTWDEPIPLDCMTRRAALAPVGGEFPSCQ